MRFTLTNFSHTYLYFHDYVHKFSIYVTVNFLTLQDIDYILWTGDLPPHDIWNQTREENLKIIKETVRQMFEMFPGIPIFPALGNHESAPVNRFGFTQNI